MTEASQTSPLAQTGGGEQAESAAPTRSIILVMLGTLSSRLLGFLRNAIVAFYFGAGQKADVLNFIQAIPIQLRRLTAEGSLETALVPELSRSHKRDPSLRESKGIWRKLLAIQFSIIFPLCLLLMLFPRSVIGLLTHFPKPEQTEMASRMLYLVSPYIFLLSQSVLLGALLSSQRRFTLSAFTPVLSSLAVIAVTVLFQAVYSVFAVLFGLLAGILLQLAFLLPPTLRSGYLMLPDFRFNDPAIRRICGIWLPLWCSTSLLALMQFVANYLASTAQSGSISALTNALLFFQLPQGLIYASIAKVCLPQMSQDSPATQTKHSGKGGMPGILRYGLSQLIILLLPATLLLVIMSEPLIAVAFQRGAFHLNNTLLTAQVLRYYALGILPISLFRFLQQYLYARSLKFQPLFQMLLVAAIDILFSFMLMGALGVVTLPIANSISYSLVLLYTAYITARQWRSSSVKKLFHRLIHGPVIRLFTKLLLIGVVLLTVDAGLKWLEQFFLAGSHLDASAYWSGLNLALSEASDVLAWWWSSGGTLRNFAVLGLHGSILLLCFAVLCRCLRIPLLRPR